MDVSSGKRNFYTLIMILSLIYGGVSLLFFLMQFSVVSSPEFASVFSNNTSSQLNDTANLSNGDRPEWRQPRPPAGITNVIYPTLFISLSGSIISIMAGLSIYFLLRKKEKEELTKGMLNVILTPEEKKVIDILEKSGRELTQSDIVSRTGLSKVKVSRVIKRLESLRIVKKYQYGMTNKIVLEENH